MVWESTSGGNIQYLKIDPDRDLLNGPVSLGTISSGNDFPDVDVDTNGNAHIVFGNIAPQNMGNEVYYAMVDGDPAATIQVPIAPTLLTVDDAMGAGSATVNVDLFDNTLYIVLKQVTDVINGTEEIFLVRVNPSLAAQDGLDADPAVLKLFEKQVTNGEGQYQWHVTSRIGGDSRIHATYIDLNPNNCSGPYSIFDKHITFTGKVITNITLTTTGSATTCDPQARGAPGRNRIVWTDSSTTGALEIWSDTFARADAGDSGLTCSLGNRNATGWNAGDLWLLLAAIAGLGVWRRGGKTHGP